MHVSWDLVRLLSPIGDLFWTSYIFSFLLDNFKCVKYSVYATQVTACTAVMS